MTDRLQQAKSVDIVWYLSQNGYKPVRENSRSAYYLSPLHTENNPSFHADKVRNRWADYGLNGAFGDLPDLVSMLEGCSLMGAVDKILGNEGIKQYHKEIDVEARKKNIDILQVDDEITCDALIEYMEKIRRVPMEIVSKHCKQVTFQFLISAWVRHFGIGFGNDLGGWNIRSTWFKGTTSPSGITTVNFTESLTILLFEGFIDYLSYEVIWGAPKHTCIVMNSIVYTPMIIDYLRGFDNVEAWWDADGPADDKIDYIISQGIPIIDKRGEYDGFNDINDYLKANFDF